MRCINCVIKCIALKMAIKPDLRILPTILNGLEFDEYDSRSSHYLIRHRSPGYFYGNNPTYSAGCQELRKSISH